MSEYILSCSSTVDLTEEHLKRRSIHYIGYPFELNGVGYSDNFGADVPIPEFYRAMAEGAETKTSQINVSEYADYFEEFLKQGKDILHIAFSSGLTGSINSASIAAGMLQNDYPDRKIRIVDSLSASSGYGLLLDKAADLRDGGMALEELAQWVEANRTKVQHWFFSTTLKYYIRGGRISKTAGFVGGVLGVCPLLTVDTEGHLIPKEKIRGKKKVIEATVAKMTEGAENGTDYSGKCYISHADSYEDAVLLAEAVKNAFPKLNGEPEIFNIGTIIGSHTGPGTVSLFFWGKPRE